MCQYHKSEEGEEHLLCGQISRPYTHAGIEVTVFICMHYQ